MKISEVDLEDWRMVHILSGKIASNAAIARADKITYPKPNLSAEIRRERFVKKLKILLERHNQMYPQGDRYRILFLFQKSSSTSKDDFIDWPWCDELVNGMLCSLGAERKRRSLKYQKINDGQLSFFHPEAFEGDRDDSRRFG